MSGSSMLSGAEARVEPFRRARVLLIEVDGSALVAPEGAEDDRRLCDVLETGAAGTLRLAADDAVLVWLPADQESRGVVLGRLGPSHAPDPGAPDELVVEARQGLTLRCGDGSISIRADGKILIKGKDLVSHAQRMNRIRGGAVAIN